MLFSLAYDLLVGMIRVCLRMSLASAAGPAGFLNKAFDDEGRFCCA